jgi:D-alanine--poly(phosphoribitol) ligase subunit 1
MNTAYTTLRAVFDRFAGEDGPAYHHIGGDLGYAGLYAQALALAGQLAAQDLDRSPVVLFGHKHRCYQVAWWACLLSGRAAIPVEPDTPVARLAVIARSCGAGLLLSTEPGTVIPALPGLDVWAMSALPPGPSARLAAPADSDVAYVMYSSGSTSQPKGIKVTYANLADFVLWLRSYLLADVAFHGVTGNVRHCFDVSLFELWAAWLRLKPVSALDHSEFLNSRKYIDRFANHGVGLWVSTPSTVQSYLKDPLFSAQSLPMLETFLFCGEVLAKPTVLLLRDRFPRATVINTYGPTECTVAVTSVIIESDHLASSRPLPIGYVRPGCELRVEDGQIVISGTCVGAGYIGLPEKQVAAFPAPQTYRTGDNGHSTPGGLWHFGGRKDREIKLLGMRMDLSDIEAEILRIDGVQTAFVEPVEVQGTCRALRAFVHGPDGATLRAIAERTANVLPPAMVPKFWHHCPELLLNLNSKADKPRMVQAALESGAAHVHVGGGRITAAAPPRQAVETTALDSLGFLKVTEAALRKHGPVVTLALPRGGRELTVFSKAAHIRFWRENEALFVKDHSVAGSGAAAMWAVLGKALQTSAEADGWADMRKEMVGLLSSSRDWFQRPLASATRRLAADLQAGSDLPLQKLCLDWATLAICDPLFANPGLEGDAWDLLEDLDASLFQRMAALPPERSDAQLSDRLEAAMRRIAAGAGAESITQAILADPRLSGGAEDRMRRIVAGLLAASLHMNGMTLFWALRHLADAPDLQRRIAEEARPFGFGPRRVTQTPLAFAALRETLRLNPVTAFLERQVAAPFTLDGMAFLPSQSVLFSPLLVQNDPDIWPDPTRFEPARFLGGSPVPKDAYLPFGLGGRICPGASVVNQQLTYALSVLCQSVRLAPAPDTRPGDLRPMFRIVLEPRGRLCLQAAPTDNPALATEGV